MTDLQRRAEATLHLLPGDTFEQASIEATDGTCRISLAGVDDDDRRIDTVVHHCQTLLAPDVRASVHREGAEAVVELEERR